MSSKENSSIGIQRKSGITGLISSWVEEDEGEGVAVSQGVDKREEIEEEEEDEKRRPSRLGIGAQHVPKPSQQVSSKAERNLKRSIEQSISKDMAEDTDGEEEGKEEVQVDDISRYSIGKGKKRKAFNLEEVIGQYTSSKKVARKQKKLRKQLEKLEAKEVKNKINGGEEQVEGEGETDKNVEWKERRVVSEKNDDGGGGERGSSRTDEALEGEKKKNKKKGKKRGGKKNKKKEDPKSKVMEGESIETVEDTT